MVGRQADFHKQVGWGKAVQGMLVDSLVVNKFDKRDSLVEEDN